MDRQEIRRLLEKARFELPVISTNIPTRKLIGESLDLLEQQPTAGEYTKKLRNDIGKYKYGRQDKFIVSSIVEQSEELCDRLDAETDIALKSLEACPLANIENTKLQDRLDTAEAIKTDLRELLREAQCPDILHCDNGIITNTFNNEKSRCVWCVKREAAIAKAKQ